MNPRDLAENLGKKFKTSTTCLAFTALQGSVETSTEFADTLETVADAMQKGAMTPDLRVQLVTLPVGLITLSKWMQPCGAK